MPTLVTGASRGLGLEFARQIAQAGDTVFATCRDPAAAIALQRVADAAPDRVRLIPLDVDDPSSIAACAQQVHTAGIPLDLLVHSAGVWAVGGPASSGPLGRLEPDALLAVLRTNAVGALAVTQALAPHLGPQATVAHLSSGLGSLARDVPRDNYGYALSKAALNMVTRYLAEDLADRDVRVVSVDPGWVRTDLGGPSARLEPAEAVTQVRAVLADLPADASGRFWNRHGEEVPW